MEEQKDIFETVHEEIDKQIDAQKGACPLTKFNSNFTLTEEEKEELVVSIVSFTGSNIDPSSLKVSAVADNGYRFNLAYNANPNTNGNTYFVYVAKVNGKFKVIGGGGTGDDVNGVKRMDDTLERLCS